MAQLGNSIDTLEEVTNHTKYTSTEFLSNNDWHLDQIKRGIAEATADHLEDHESILALWVHKNT